jgi:hypothetical protein
MYASIIRVRRIGELGTMLVVTSNRLTLQRNTNSILQLLVTANVSSSPILVTLMMEVICSSEMSVLTRAAWHNIPEDGSPQLIWNLPPCQRVLFLNMASFYNKTMLFSVVVPSLKCDI